MILPDQRRSHIYFCTGQARCIVSLRHQARPSYAAAACENKWVKAEWVATYFVTERMILAEMCKKKMEPMKDNAKMRTTKGSL